MGFTWERRCCAGGWLSRLDVNTCHRRMHKSVYYYCVAVAHILSIQGTHKSTKVVPNELNKGG